MVFAKHHSSAPEAFGFASKANSSSFIFDLGWMFLPIDPLSICRNFFNLPLKGRLIGAEENLDSGYWKGISSQWDLWGDDSNCQIRLDRRLILYLISQALGAREDDANFSCRSLTEIEKEIIENFMQELIEHFNEQLQDLPMSQNNSQYAGRSLNLIWAIEAGGEIGKIAVGFPVERMPTNFLKIESNPIRSPEDCIEATLKLDLLVGQSRLTLADLARLENEDFVFLEQSDKNSLKIVGMEGLDLIIPIVIPAEQKKFMSGHKNWHKINLSMSDIEEAQTMNQALSGDVLSSFPVDVKAEFKEVKMTLKDLFALQSGWVLQLDQIVDNELLLVSQGKTIAKGELVVAGDKFGILVKEVFLKNQSISHDEEIS